MRCAALLVCLVLVAPALAGGDARPVVEAKATAPDPDPAAPPAHLVRYHDDTLTLHVHQAPLRSVIDEVGRETGADIKGELVKEHDVSVVFDDVPLREALERLLRDQNFTIGYGEGGKPRTIELLGGPLAPPEKKAVAGATAPDDAPDAHGYRAKPWPPDDVKPAADALWKLFTDQRELPVTGRLAEALGTKHATFKRLALAAANEDDPTVRTRAMLAGMNVINADPGLRSALADTLASLDDEDIAHFLRQFAGEHAEEWVTRFALHSHDAQLRSRMSPVLQQLGGLGPEK